MYICRVNVLIINVSGVAHTSLWTRYWQGSVHTAALPPTTIMQLVKRHGAAQEVLYGAGPQTNLLEVGNKPLSASRLIVH